MMMMDDGNWKREIPLGARDCLSTCEHQSLRFILGKEPTKSQKAREINSYLLSSSGAIVISNFSNGTNDVVLVL
jgi:hypothetical protein